MLEFSVLTSILQAHRKVITLKHEIILKNNPLENYILKNYILKNYISFVICFIVKLQGHECLIKKKHKYPTLQAVQCPLFAPYIC